MWKKLETQITVSGRSKVRNDFAPSYSSIVDSNPIRDMDICPCFSCVGNVLAAGLILCPRSPTSSIISVVLD
jgi:hypothetical protein